jgi:pimeloyl-ACP methyl ester carboxylesterase
MKKSSFLLFLYFSTTLGWALAQNESTAVETTVSLLTETGELFGTLTTPEKFEKIPVALIIAGSGPTDRDGNNPMMKNNSLKILAHELSQIGIAALRFDKRGVAKSGSAAKSEGDLRFDDYVNDAKDWIRLLKKDSRFSKVIVIGHSEGSLIGMIAATHADKFISIAGAGKSADLILKEQLSKQPEEVQNLTFPVIDSLKNGTLVSNVSPMVFSLFRPSVQPYMISWFNYDPQMEIQKLSIPTLIIQGTNDIQVTQEDARQLSAGNTKAKLVFIKDMNHIFRIIEGGAQENIASYSKSDLPISNDLVNSISTFIYDEKIKEN